MNETMRAERILTNGEPYEAARDYIGAETQVEVAREKLLDFVLTNLSYFTDETIDTDSVDWEELAPFFVWE